MKLNPLHLHLPLWSRVKGMFNLNDPRWGRDDDAPPRESTPGGHQNEGDRPRETPPRQGQRPQGANQGPPDLDELWRDFNRKLGGFFGGGRGGRGEPNGRTPPAFKPDPKSTGIGVGLIAGVAALIWLGTGFFIVQEGQQAVITQFGKYHSTVGAGFNWRLPYPVQRHESVFVTQIRSVDVGRDAIVPATGLRESAMLTQDENIVEIKFAVQYRLNDARAYLFASRDPDAAVIRAAETAVREVVGNMKMDAALAEERDQIAPRVRTLMQTILDRYSVGIEVVGINLQQGGVRPPEQVQASFDDVLKAGQERERAKNEAEAYANDVVPRARGAASRLIEEAEGYKARIVAQAQGDAQRFRLVQTEHAKAPQVTRERLYLETMQQVYGNVTKVLIDTRQNSNLLYLPLDKIMQSVANASPAAAVGAAAVSPAPSAGTAAPPTPSDARNREDARSRERESR
ncbi:FtsH protease activity modulator HflK [Macromonas nakdongensis]|uniref:FtsH protease activity modulator HflK n=1 Tax=Macromonas nakdongensis TaxID=1843082 RepID=UPI000C31F091|nr:FtsH protease activity modulator HflK [Macromonas nakdongensis]